MILIDLLGYFSSRLDYLKALGDDSLLVESISIKFMGGTPQFVFTSAAGYMLGQGGGGVWGGTPQFSHHLAFS